jgi:hypothetical protein
LILKRGLCIRPLIRLGGSRNIPSISTCPGHGKLAICAHVAAQLKCYSVGRIAFTHSLIVWMCCCAKNEKVKRRGTVCLKSHKGRTWYVGGGVEGFQSTLDGSFARR